MRVFKQDSNTQSQGSHGKHTPRISSGVNPARTSAISAKASLLGARTVIGSSTGSVANAAATRGAAPSRSCSHRFRIQLALKREQCCEMSKHCFSAKAAWARNVHCELKRNLCSQVWAYKTPQGQLSILALRASGKDIQHTLLYSIRPVSTAAGFSRGAQL